MRLPAQCRRCLEWAGARLERNTAMFLAAFAGLYLAITCGIAALKPLWFDELFTYHLSHYADLGELWAALGSFEPNPPLAYLLTRASRSVFGDNPLAVRLPEVISFLVLSLCLFRFVARRCALPYAWVALVLPLTTTAYGYAHEARAYALMLGFGGLALVCWQDAAEVRRPLMLAGLALSLAAAVSSHYYAVLLFVPFSLGELVRLAERRRPDFRRWAALALGAAPLVFLYPLIRAARENATTFWARVEWWSVVEGYQTLLAPAVVPLLVSLPLLALVRRRRRARPDAGAGAALSALPRHEIAAALGLVLLPLVGVLLGKLVTGVYSHRYVLMAVPGFSILLAFILSRAAGNCPVVGTALTVVLVGWFTAAGAVRIPLNAGRTVEVRHTAAFLAAECTEPLPIAIAHPHAFMRLAHYAPPELAERLVAVNDPEASLRYIGHDTDEKALRGLRTLIPLNIPDYAAFISSHARFYVFGDDEWLAHALEADGVRLRPLTRHGGTTLFLATTTKGR